MLVRTTNTAADALKKAEHEFSHLAYNMTEIAREGALHLRDTDHYQNRTGDLRSGTRAYAETASDEITVYLEMDTHYASFVKNLGFSNFDEVASEARGEIGKGIAGIGDRITGSWL